LSVGDAAGLRKLTITGRRRHRSLQPGAALATLMCATALLLLLSGCDGSQPPGPQHDAANARCLGIGGRPETDPFRCLRHSGSHR
jgi:hypothetical protein